MSKDNQLYIADHYYKDIFATYTDAINEYILKGCGNENVKVFYIGGYGRTNMNEEIAIYVECKNGFVTEIKMSLMSLLTSQLKPISTLILDTVEREHKEATELVLKGFGS